MAIDSRNRRPPIGLCSHNCAGDGFARPQARRIIALPVALLFWLWPGHSGFLIDALFPGHDIKPLAQALTESLEDYFSTLNGTPPCELYETILREIEVPLLSITLKHTGGNQSKAAEWLGLNRATLRKKLQQHKLDPNA